MTTTPTHQPITGVYGPDHTYGVLSEHLHRVPPEKVRTLASGTLVVQAGRECFPVLCSEVVPIATEDGIVSGRCGGRVKGIDGFACEGHTRQIEGWREQSELDAIEWEQRV
jgi:hypothetical protein